MGKSGINVIVVTNKFPSEPSVSKNPEMTIYRFPLLRSSNAVKFQMLFNPDVWLSNSFRRLFKWADIVYIPRFWYSAIPIAKAYKKPVLVHLHDYVSICPLSSLYNFDTNTFCKSGYCSQKCIYTYEKVFGRDFKSCFASTLLNSTFGRRLRSLILLSDGIICVSKAQRDIILRQIPQFQNKIHVIYNPMPECKATRIQGDDYGFLGGSNPIKGFDVLHSGLAQIKGDLNVTLHATNFPTPLRAPEEIAHAKIIFYLKLTSAQLDNIYNKIRAVVFPSICPEPLPYVLGEAVLKGRLVIASDIGGLRELGAGCKGVFFFKPGDSQGLAEKLSCVGHLSRADVFDLASQSREHFVKNFDSHLAVQRFLGVCDLLIENKN